MATLIAGSVAPKGRLLDRASGSRACSNASAVTCKVGACRNRTHLVLWCLGHWSEASHGEAPLEIVRRLKRHVSGNTCSLDVARPKSCATDIRERDFLTGRRFDGRMAYTESRYGDLRCRYCSLLSEEKAHSESSLEMLLALARRGAFPEPHSCFAKYCLATMYRLT